MGSMPLWLARNITLTVNHVDREVIRAGGFLEDSSVDPSRIRNCARSFSIQRVQSDCHYGGRAQKTHMVLFLGPNSILADGMDPLGIA